MDHGFGIDTAFEQAVTRWCSSLNGEAVQSITLRGGEGALLPSDLVIDTPSGEIQFDVGDWPHDLPHSREALRHDPRVWELFTTEWSVEEIRNYVGLDDSADADAVREAFVRSSWWREFEEMVTLAFAYEWRAALEVMHKRWDARVVVARPDPDESSLYEFEERLNQAAGKFEASTFDARLLYDESARKAAFLIHTSEASEAEVE